MTRGHFQFPSLVLVIVLFCGTLTIYRRYLLKDRSKETHSIGLWGTKKMWSGTRSVIERNEQHMQLARTLEHKVLTRKLIICGGTVPLLDGVASRSKEPRRNGDFYIAQSIQGLMNAYTQFHWFPYDIRRSFHVESWRTLQHWVPVETVHKRRTIIASRICRKAEISDGREYWWICSLQALATFSVAIAVRPKWYRVPLENSSRAAVLCEIGWLEWFTYIKFSTSASLSKPWHFVYSGAALLIIIMMQWCFRQNPVGSPDMHLLVEHLHGRHQTRWPDGRRCAASLKSTLFMTADENTVMAMEAVEGTRPDAKIPA